MFQRCVNTILCTVYLLRELNDLSILFTDCLMLAKSCFLNTAYHLDLCGTLLRSLEVSLHRPLVSRLQYLHRPCRGRTEPVRGRLEAHTSQSSRPASQPPERLYRPRQISHMFTFSAVRRHENSCCDPRAGHYTPSLPSLAVFQKLYDRCQSSP